MTAMDNGLAINPQDHIPRPQTGAPGRTVTVQAGDYDALGLDQAEGFRQVAGQRLNLHAQPAADDPATLDDLFHDVNGQMRRDGEADALGAAGLGKNGSIDADQPAMGVNQRAAGVALV